MSDKFTQKQRSYIMSRIRAKDTSPEVIVRKILWYNGFRYRLYGKKLPGSPDIVFPSLKKVIFVNGCFWHKHNCKKFKWPKSNVEFWKNKITRNVKRDRSNYKDLNSLGWEYLVIWECDIRKKRYDDILEQCIDFLCD